MALKFGLRTRHFGIFGNVISEDEGIGGGGGKVKGQELTGTNQRKSIKGL